MKARATALALGLSALRLVRAQNVSITIPTKAPSSAVSDGARPTGLGSGDSLSRTGLFMRSWCTTKSLYCFQVVTMSSGMAWKTLRKISVWAEKVKRPSPLV